MVRNLPNLLGNLLCLSWIIDTVPGEYLDALNIVEWLEKISSVGESLILNRWIFIRNDSLEVLYELADAMEEIDEIVELYAESVLAILDTVSEPDASHSTIGLSSMEHARIASAFLLLKIFRIYNQYIGVTGNERDFMNTLDLSLVEDMVTVNTFLEEAGRTSGSALYYLVDAKYRSRRTLCDASVYAWNYYEARNSPRPLPSLYLTLAKIDGPGVELFYESHPTTIERFRLVTGTDEGRPSGNMGLHDFGATASAGFPLSYGWKLLHKIEDDIGISIKYYREIFLRLGMFFWDEDRFLHMRMTSTSEYQALVERFEEAYYRAHVNVYDNIPHDVAGSGGCVTTAHGHRVKPEDIFEWTRCKVQCTFGEWMMRSQSCRSR